MAKKKFLKRDSDQPGIKLLVLVEGVGVKIPKKAIREFRLNCQKFIRTHFKIQELEAKRDDLKAKIEAIVRKFPFLSGIESKKEQGKLIAFDSMKREPNIEILKTSLGTLFSAIVTESLSLEIVLTPELNKNFFIEKIKEAVGSKVFETHISVKSEVEVDYTRFLKLLNEGKFTPIPGSFSEDITFKVRVDEIKKEAVPK